MSFLWRQSLRRPEPLRLQPGARGTRLPHAAVVLVFQRQSTATAAAFCALTAACVVAACRCRQVHVRTAGQKRYGITNEAATHLFADKIVTAAPGFNAGTGRHIRAQQASDWCVKRVPACCLHVSTAMSGAGASSLRLLQATRRPMLGPSRAR